MRAFTVKDFQFGLKLVAQNTGQTEFTLDEQAVEAPDKILSQWVVASYQKADAASSSESPPPPSPEVAGS